MLQKKKKKHFDITILLTNLSQSFERKKYTVLARQPFWRHPVVMTPRAGGLLLSQEWGGVGQHLEGEKWEAGPVELPKGSEWPAGMALPWLTPPLTKH